MIAYAGFKVIVKKSDVGFNNTVNRGITTGERLLHVVENPAFIAKNRYNCPESFEMKYEEIVKHDSDLSNIFSRMLILTILILWNMLERL